MRSLISLSTFSIFWDAVTHAITSKYKINKVYFIKTKYTLLVIARL